MKANFKLNEDAKTIAKAGKKEINNKLVHKKTQSYEEITPEEFEEFIIKTGAAGSFMIFRSDKKDDELGIEEL